MQTILIAGGGIGGLCTAIALQKQGFCVKVFEAAGEIKPLGAGLVLAANAVRALDFIGIKEVVVKEGKMLNAFTILSDTGNAISKVNTRKIKQDYDTGNFTIHRAELHKALLSQLQEDTLITGKKCTGIKQNDTEVTLFFEDGSKETGDYLIAADGVHSVIRQQLIPGSIPRYSGYTCWRAVIDAGMNEFGSDRSSETWGPKGRFGIVPLTSNRIYWFACINGKEQDKRLEAYSARDLLNNFRNYHHPISEILSLTNDSQLLRNDIIDIKPIKQFAFARVLLLGDAAHATTPNMGQGACQAIEDAAVLSNCISKTPDIGQAFRSFEKKRIARTTRIVNISRSIGAMAQWENPLLCRLRNTMLRNIPESMSARQLEFLFDIDFLE